MAIDIQFMPNEPEDIRLRKMRLLVEEIVRLSQRTNSSSSGSGGVPGAQYILAGSNASLPNAFVLRAASGISLSLSGGFATLSLGTVPLASLEHIGTQTLLGRFSSGTGPPESIAIGAGLQLTAGGVLQTSSSQSAGYPSQLGYAGI